MTYYAGNGSRETPEEDCRRMTRIARDLRARDYKLRSGGARGADTAFAKGAGSDAVIYVPDAQYKIEPTGAPTVICGENPRLREIARRLHPAWHRCDRLARQLHTRNVAQIIGTELDDPLSEFVICWTPLGSGLGGTGGALRVAAEYHVRKYDLALKADSEALLRRLEC